MAQESSGLKLDDERPEVRSDLDRDEGLSNTSITEANAAADDDRDLSLSADETTEDSETAAETEQLRQDIEGTRASMGQTIDAIQERLSISNISEQVSEQVSQAIETAKDSVYEATIGKVANLMKEAGRGISGSNIGRTITQNPWPFALIGLGSAWLIYDNMSGSRRRHNGNGRMRLGSGGSRYGERNYLTSQQGTGEGQQSGMLSDATESVSNAASSAYGTVASTASNAVQTVSSTASGTYNKAADVAGRAYEKAGEFGHIAQEKYEEYVETKPLAVAAAAAAVGAAIGFAIPSTQYEGELVGETRDNLMAKASDAATQLVDKAKEVAGEAGQVVKEELNSATQTTSGSTAGFTSTTGTTGTTGRGTTGTTGSSGTSGGGGRGTL